MLFVGGKPNVDRSPNSSTDLTSWKVDTFPDDFGHGVTVLLASAGDPARYSVDLQALCEYGGRNDTAVAVTTTASAETTLETYQQLCPGSERPTLQFVDTTANQPSVPALYGDASTITIPSPGDLERLVIALSDLSDATPPSSGARHLVIRSLTPILDEAPVSRVCTVLDRVTGLRAKSGLCLLGIDYTAHDEDTIRTLTEQVDGILWVTESSLDELQFEYRPNRSRYGGELLETPE